MRREIIRQHVAQRRIDGRALDQIIADLRIVRSNIANREMQVKGINQHMHRKSFPLSFFDLFFSGCTPISCDVWA